VLHSAETRWFIAKILPDEVLDWFRAGQALETEGVQVHEYLLFPDCDTGGVKLRAGKLDIKAMVSAPRPLSRELGVSGRTDRWVKWSFASQGLKTLDRELHQSGRWLKVRKERLLRKFSAGMGGLVEVTARQRPLPASGCNVELTRIAVKANPQFWFSLAFETLGPPALAVKILGIAIQSFFQEHGRAPGIRLSQRNSLSYPAWLVNLTKTPEKADENLPGRA
jgi:hypothetical protein